MVAVLNTPKTLHSAHADATTNANDVSCTPRMRMSAGRGTTGIRGDVGDGLHGGGRMSRAELGSSGFGGIGDGDGWDGGGDDGADGGMAGTGGKLGGSGGQMGGVDGGGVAGGGGGAAT